VLGYNTIPRQSRTKKGPKVQVTGKTIMTAAEILLNKMFFSYWPDYTERKRV